MACILAGTLPHALRAQSPSAAVAPNTASAPVIAADGGVVQGATVPLGRFVRAVSFVRDSQERRIGTITETITAVGTGADATLVRAQEIALGGRLTIDTAVSRRSTLAPIWHNSKQPAASMVLRFDGRHVTGSHTTGDNAPEPVDQTVSVATFDSNNQELVLGAMPFAVGARARLPMYVYETKGISWCDVAVVGLETIDGVPAWKVDATYAGARGSYWYARDSHVLLRNEMVLPTGMTMRVVLVK